MFSKVFEYFLLTCLKAEQVYPERGGGLPLVLQQPHAAADHERDGGGPRQVHLQVTCTSVHLCVHCIPVHLQGQEQPRGDQRRDQPLR